jgi:diazepam-binding inhibitor (GABA receptor modulator, acyl-CoA-binding protein)
MMTPNKQTLVITLYFEYKLPFKIVGTYPNSPQFNRIHSRVHRNFAYSSGVFMSDLTAKFEAAVANSKNLSERPDNATMLKLYALYKQSTAGDNADKKPGFSDMVGRAKWDAWNGMKGTGSDAAKQQYIDLVESLS